VAAHVVAIAHHALAIVAHHVAAIAHRALAIVAHHVAAIAHRALAIVAHHDAAMAARHGQIMLLTDLCDGQQATVLQLPASEPHVPSNDAQRREPSATLRVIALIWPESPTFRAWWGSARWVVGG
jgi:hypothetical protein